MLLIWMQLYLVLTYLVDVSLMLKAVIENLLFRVFGRVRR